MRKGFTLIELLAVIVILAIIATIATPIVLDIINDTRESATLRSAEYYLDAVETSIATAILKNTNINDGAYKLKDGDICLDSSCIQKLEVQIKGETPESGKIYIEEGQIKDVTLFLDNKVIAKSEDNELIYTELEYKIGDEVTFNPGDKDRTWNVIDEDATTVTLMLSENLGETVAWYADDWDRSYGPKDALNYLNSLTTNWTNVDPIENYSYINNLNGTKSKGYQKIEIKNGVTKLTHKDGQIITNVEGISKARILSEEEVYEIAAKTNTNLTEKNLIAFIEENLETLNTILQSEGMEVELKTVDDVISITAQLEPMIVYESKYYQIHSIVLAMVDSYQINPEHDMSIPEYIYQNLDSDENTTFPEGYWTLSSVVGASNETWYVTYSSDTGLPSCGVSWDNLGGVRPVITILKSKL